MEMTAEQLLEIAKERFSELKWEEAIEYYSKAIEAEVSIKT